MFRNITMLHIYEQLRYTVSWLQIPVCSPHRSVVHTQFFIYCINSQYMIAVWQTIYGATSYIRETRNE
jgi:hypothetical protein